MRSLYILLVLVLIGATLPAQIPQLEITGHIQSDSLAGSGIRNVVADANGLLKIDSNTVTSSLIELRDSTGDLKFRIDADQRLFQLLHEGDTVFYVKQLDSVIIDTSAQAFLPDTELSKKIETTGQLIEKVLIEAVRNKMSPLLFKIEANVPANSFLLPRRVSEDVKIGKDINGQTIITWKNDGGEVKYEARFSTSGELIQVKVVNIVDTENLLTFRKDGSFSLYSNVQNEVFLFDSDCNLVGKIKDASTVRQSPNGTRSNTITDNQVFIQGATTSTEMNDGGVTVTQNQKQVRMDRDGTFIGDDNTQSRDITKDGDEYENSSNGNKVTITVDANANTIDMGSAKVTAGAFCPPSDRRLKKEVKSLIDPLDHISQLRPASYLYKNERLPQEMQYGFIAQEVKKVLPSLVTEFEGSRDEAMGSDPYLTINYIGLIPILTKGIQELSNQNDRQSQLIQQLKLGNEAVPTLKKEVQQLNDLAQQLLERLQQLENISK